MPTRQSLFVTNENKVFKKSGEETNRQSSPLLLQESVSTQIHTHSLFTAIILPTQINLLLKRCHIGCNSA